jgi:predicted thioredoxin/glutaredoxin
MVRARGEVDVNDLWKERYVRERIPRAREVAGEWSGRILREIIGNLIRTKFQQ